MGPISNIWYSCLPFLHCLPRTTFSWFFSYVIGHSFLLSFLAALPDSVTLECLRAQWLLPFSWLAILTCLLISPSLVALNTTYMQTKLKFLSLVQNFSWTLEFHTSIIQTVQHPSPPGCLIRDISNSTYSSSPPVQSIRKPWSGFTFKKRLDWNLYYLDLSHHHHHSPVSWGTPTSSPHSYPWQPHAHHLSSIPQPEWYC